MAFIVYTVIMFVVLLGLFALVSGSSQPKGY